MLGGIAGIGLVITYLGAAWSGPGAEGNLFDSGFLSGLGAIAILCLIGVFLFPRTVGMAFTPVNRLAIQANIIGLGAVSGTRNNENGVADVNTSDFGLNVWRAPASVSLVWYFGRGLE
jgi:hypothetical protein